MATVRQRDEDTSRMHRSREWPVRNESLRAIPRPVIGLPARPDSALSQRRPSDPDSKVGRPKSMLGRSHSAGATSVYQREVRHIPTLSVSSENGESIDITNTDLRHGVHQSQQSTVASRDVVPTLHGDKHGDKHGGALSVHPHDDFVVDMAMEIAEEVSVMCATPRPVDTDESFVSAGLNAGSARRLEEWLYARFDSYSPAARLMDKKVTAEVLATEILARSSFPRSRGEHDTRPGKLRTPPPATLSAAHSDETRVQDDRSASSPPSKRTRRKDLSIKLEEDLVVTSHATLSPYFVRTSSPSIHPGTIPTRREGLKSGGLMLGIFTVGAMLGSPLTTNFDQPGSGSMLAFPASSILPSFYASSAQLSARHIDSRSDNFLAPVSPWRRETPLMPRSPLVAA